jgi:oligopeptide transport system substrate-binding protein
MFVPVALARRALLSLPLLLALAACGSPQTSNGAGGAATSDDAGQTAAGTPAVLRRGNAAEIDSLDPQLAVLTESAAVLRDVYEGLLRIGPGLQPAPAAAERWEVSADGLTYTFHLRPQARWSDGEPVTSGDFVASWRRLVDPATGSPNAKQLQAVKNALRIVAGEAAVDSLGASAPDPRTLVVTLERPTPMFPFALTHWSTLPTPRGQPPVKAGGTVSNGAFVLTRWTVGTEVEVRRNRAYWNDRATRLDGVRYVHFADSADEYTRFRAGELDVTQNLPMMPLDELRRAQGDAVRISPSLAVYYYGFNLKKAPFDSREVRQALSMTVDRERLTASVTRMGERPAYSWVPPDMPDYTPQAPAWAALPYPERVRQARELLTKAGYGPKRPLRFELRHNTGAAHEKIAIAVSAMWKEALGAEVTLAAEEFKSLLQTIQRGEAEVFRSSWAADTPDPASFLEIFGRSHELNLTGYGSASYDAALALAIEEMDPARRREILQGLERQIGEDAPVVPLYFMVNRRLVSPRVVGWTDNPLRVVYSQDVQLRN